jgi:uncharacterized protein (DUF1697 family)
MRNEKLRDFFENLGFKNVQTVISSGNVIFESPSKDPSNLEATIEKALPEQLGFTSTAIVRSRDQLQRLVQEDHFNGLEDTPKSRLNVTFLKVPSITNLKFPYSPDNKGYSILKHHDQAIFSSIDLSSSKTPDLMGWLERQFSKNITTRTWKTVHRILNKM